MIEDLVAGGALTLLALVALAIEALVLVLFARGRIGIAAIVANCLSGVFLILALRAALLDEGAVMVATYLGLGFLAHMSDLALRLRRREP